MSASMYDTTERLSCGHVIRDDGTVVMYFATHALALRAYSADGADAPPRKSEKPERMGQWFLTYAE